MEKISAIVYLTGEGEASSLMLEPILFDPAALWLCESLKRAGAERFLVVCDRKDKERCAACFPEGTVVTAAGEDREELHTFLETPGRVMVITEPVFLVNSAVERLAKGQTRRGETTEDEEVKTAGASGVYELSDAARQAILSGEDAQAAVRDKATAYEELGAAAVDRAGLLEDLSRLARRQSVRRLQKAGVRFLDPEAVYVGPRVSVESGTFILPGTILRGETRVGKNCQLGPNTMLRDVSVGEGTSVNASQCNECTIGSFTTVGPFAYIRPNTQVGDHVKVGDFVELKNSVIGDETKISHLTYVGDSDVGEHINFGCGTVTVNYDGAKKFRTKIGDGAFIGCNTNLVAPVSVGQGAYIAAGSTITRDVPSDSLAIARSQQTVKNQWAKKRRAKQQQEKKEK